MNILQILPELKTGGVERGTVDLAQALVNAGHKAVVVSAGGRLVEELNKIGVKHFTLNVHKKSLFSILYAAYFLGRIINNEHIDIVHARSRVPAWISYFALMRSPGVALVTTCHGHYNTHFFSRVMGWGKQVIVISQVIGRHMINNFKVSKEKIRLIYRGVDLNTFRFRRTDVNTDKNEKLIGIIGRITPIKGHVHFIKSLPSIISEFPKAKALIIGDAPTHRQPYLKELVNLIEKLQLKEKVKLIGTLKDIPDILAKLDLLVLATTTEEAFGRVVIEAGAVGVPVVATRVGGVVEIIEHEKNGLLVEAADPYALSQAAIRLLKDKDLRLRCVNNLRKKVEKEFSLSTMVKKTIAVYEQIKRNKHILVIKLGALGDVILISSALKALREHFPGAYIEVLVKNEFKTILQICPYLDDLIILRNKSLAEIVKRILLLRKKEFDIAVDFQNNNLSHFMSFAAGIPMRYGYKNKKLGFLLNQPVVETDQKLDPLMHQLQVLNLLGIKNIDKNLQIWISDKEEEFIEEFLTQNWYNKNQLLIGINAIASHRWKSKLWHRQRYAQIADMLAENFNARVVFTGTENDLDSVEKIISHTKCKPINACGKTSLMQLAALIRRCSVLLTVDSAPMHIAAAVRTPFVALFGPTDPECHLPFSEKFALIKKDLKCSPCYKSSCFRKSCMAQITVEEVYKVITSLLAPKQQRAT